MQRRAVGSVMAVARVYALVFAVVVLGLELAPGPFFGPQPDAFDRLVMALPGLAMLAIGWAWLLRIRRGIDRP